MCTECVQNVYRMCKEMCKECVQNVYRMSAYCAKNV